MPLVGDSKTMKVSAVASDGEFWVSKVLKTIEELEKDTKHVALFTEIDEDDKELCNKARQVLVKVQKVGDLLYLSVHAIHLNLTFSFVGFRASTRCSKRS